MPQTTIDDALDAAARTDPTFFAEVRKRLAPVKDRFFAVPVSARSDHMKDGLYTAPAWLTDPELNRVAIELAELALARGVDVNVAWEADGRTLLHYFVLLRDSAITVDAVRWLLEHGADPNKPKEGGEKPFHLALRYKRTEVAEVMRTHGGR